MVAQRWKNSRRMHILAALLAVFLAATACVEDPPPPTNDRLVIATNTLPVVWLTEPGQIYDAQLLALSEQPVTWSIPGPSEPHGLPIGLILNPTTGVISGIPTNGVTGELKVTATDGVDTVEKMIPLTVYVDKSVIVSDPHGTALDDYFLDGPDEGYLSVFMSDTGQHFQAGPGGFTAGVGFESGSLDGLTANGAAYPVAGNWQALGYSPKYDRVARLSADFAALVIFDARDGSGDETNAVRLEMGGSTQESVSELAMPVWSPNGRYLAASAYLDQADRYITRIFDSHDNYNEIRVIDHTFTGGFHWIDNDEFIVGSMPKMAEVYSGIPATTVPERQRLSNPDYRVPLVGATGFTPVAVSPNGRIAFYGYEIAEPGVSVEVQLITTAADGTTRRVLLSGIINILPGPFLPVFASSGQIPMAVLGNSLQRQHVVHFSPDGTQIATSVGGLIPPVTGTLSQQYAAATIIHDAVGQPITPITVVREYPIGTQGEVGYTRDWVFGWSDSLQPYYVAE